MKAFTLFCVALFMSLSVTVVSATDLPKDLSLACKVELTKALKKADIRFIDLNNQANLDKLVSVHKNDKSDFAALVQACKADESVQFVNWCKASCWFGCFEGCTKKDCGACKGD